MNQFYLHLFSTQVTIKEETLLVAATHLNIQLHSKKKKEKKNMA